MKKLIFGVALMLSGIIGASAWMIACASLVDGWTTMLNLFFDGSDGYIVLFFYAAAILGAVIAVRGLKEDSD